MNNKHFLFQTTVNRDGSLAFECQHGPTECDANIYHACSIEAIQEPKVLLDMVACMIKDNVQPKQAMIKVSTIFPLILFRKIHETCSLITEITSLNLTISIFIFFLNFLYSSYSVSSSLIFIVYLFLFFVNSAPKNIILTMNQYKSVSIVRTVLNY